MPRPALTPYRLTVFRTRLGWMAAIGAGRVLKRLTFGHPSARQAVASLGPAAPAAGRRGAWNPELVRRLQAYAAGRPDSFRDVRVDPGPLTEFQRRVISICRGIPYGRPLTYAQGAAQAGSPGAARAVGNCMAANRLPLVIPCHRVVGSDGQLGGYSAPGGLKTKRLLLALEAGPSREERPIQGGLAERRVSGKL